MGFWNALSVLAPVAPAMSDAQDIRTQRTQDAAKFAQDQALNQAQLTVRQLAAQGDTQKNQDAQTIRNQLGVPLRSYTDANGSQHTVYFTKDGQTKDVQDTPSAGERLQSYISTLKQNGVKVTPEQEAAIAPGFFGQHMAVGAGAKPVTLKGPDGQPMGASFTNGRYFDANGDEVTNPVLWEKPVAPKATNPYLDWKAQNPNGTVDQYEAMIGRTRVNAAGGPGSWTVAEGADGGTTLYNSKTGETRQAPDGLHKSGYYTKNIAPLEAAKLNVTDYLNNGVYDGPGDLSLQHAFFTATQPSAGFRMTKIQQDTLQNSRGWLGGLEARARHAQTGEWYTPEQRKQIADAALSAIADKEKALQGIIPPKTPTPGGGSPQKFKVNDFFMQGGHKFKATAVDQNGKVTAADPVG